MGRGDLGLRHGSFRGERSRLYFRGSRGERQLGSGPGVTAARSVSGATVTLTAGSTTDEVCKESAG